MFLVSGVDLVAAACRNGVIGSFPTVNCREVEQLDGWLTEIESRLQRHSDTPEKPGAPLCANLIGISSNVRVVAPATLERSLGKAKRLYDKRPKD